MKCRTKPVDWKLDGKSNDELLRLALNKLRQRTIREGEKMDEKFEAGDKDEKQRSKFYSLWYAFEALRIYAKRHGVKVEEPFDYTKKRTRDQLKADFYRVYANLPLAMRSEIIAVVLDEPMTWQVVKIEIDAGTLMSSTILAYLDKLELI